MPDTMRGYNWPHFCNKATFASFHLTMTLFQRECGLGIGSDWSEYCCGLARDFIIIFPLPWDVRGRGGGGGGNQLRKSRTTKSIDLKSSFNYTSNEAYFNPLFTS